MTAKTATRKSAVQVHSTRAVLDSLAASRRDEAAAKHAGYSQYDGYWDNWRIAEIIKTRKARGRVQFAAGDLVLVAPDTTREKVAPRGRGLVAYDEWPEVEFATAFSFRTGWNTAVRADYVREVVVTD